ncbi:alginate export family protein [Flavobacterium undicola]|uniref:alginate export family protein n=1 Tax=Flavobacterium undicola TaxID=1932779 RepID=UPI001376B756|nr:alginate export family protein [Flavobacterium undicola]MBA0882652.1 alginate export family protein [Flavobacterium undicola]
MKKTKKTLYLAAITILALFSNQNMTAQIDSNLTKLLLEKKIITQREADSLSVLNVFNQKVNSENKNFSIGLEFRPRTEYRDGYRQLRTADTKAAFFTTQRSRLDFNYSQPKFKFHTSIQDIRVLGQYGQTSTSGSLNVFEAYVDADITDQFFVRIGRQKVDLDNGRLFSQANWSQAGRAHDGINLIYDNNSIHSEFFTSFNQTAERIFDTDFSPTTFTNYKLLNVHYLKAKLNEHFSLTTINAADSYQSKTTSGTLYTRGTSGGRLDFEKGNLYVTLSGYYQYGQLQTAERVSAYYFQPEIQLKNGKLTTRLGAEFMSGENAEKVSDFSKSFVPLYGVAWKFMGNMDYFTTFPTDVKKGGLFNPYLFFIYDLNKKVALRSDFHLFYLGNKTKNDLGNTINSYLGFENDLSVKYKCNSFITADFGFSYMAAEKSMETLKTGNSNIIPVWSYVMITFKPELFSFKK